MVYVNENVITAVVGIVNEMFRVQQKPKKKKQKVTLLDMGKE